MCKSFIVSYRVVSYKIKSRAKLIHGRVIREKVDIAVCRISYCHLPFQSKWLYVGTERGNVHVVSLESFTLSGYIINWNKAIEL